jgi:hypothetical protein
VLKDHLDNKRYYLSLELEANSIATLEDLYTDDEQDFTIKLYKKLNLL